MRFPLLAALGLAMMPVRAPAQFSLRVGAGATLGSTLVSNAVLYDDAVSLRTATATTIAIALGYPIAPRYRLLLEGRIASGGLSAKSNAGTNDLGSLRTMGVVVLAEGPLPYHLRFQLGGGALKYSPSRASGVFADDAPIKPMVTAGLDWTRPMGRGLDLHVGGRWDLHEFTTGALQRRGWSLAQRVHRVALTVGVERGF